MPTTGSSATSWNWLSNATTGAALVVAEATWLSLLLNAAVNTSKHVHVYLPFLALALPAVLATYVAAAARNVARRWWWRVALLAPVLVLGAALSAGTIAALSHAGLWWQVATTPWSVHGHLDATVAGVSWLAAAVAWGRGTWVGATLPSFRHGAWSVGLGAVAFLGVFAGRAASGAVAFRGATGPAGWLLFIAFPCACAALALIRQRDLETQVGGGAGRTHPDKAWFAVLAVPMLAVALVALLVAVTVGPAAPVVGRGVEWAAKGIWWLIATPVEALWHLLPHSHPKPSPVRANGHLGHSSAHPALAGKTSPPHIPLAAAYAALAVVVLLALRLGRHLRPFRGMKRGQGPDTAAGAEQRDSVFSWGHLGDQLRSAVRSFFGRWRRQPRHHGLVTGPDTDLPDGSPESVRTAYRRMLTAARSNGHGRRLSETPLELERRLSQGPALDGAGALADLTALYDEVRYGERVPMADEPAQAAAQATAVSAAFASTGSGTDPSRGP